MHQFKKYSEILSLTGLLNLLSYTAWQYVSRFFASVDQPWQDLATVIHSHLGRNIFVLIKLVSIVFRFCCNYFPFTDPDLYLMQFIYLMPCKFLFMVITYKVDVSIRSEIHLSTTNTDGPPHLYL